MCNAPITIKNKGFDSTGEHRTKYSVLHPFMSRYIEVPCGVCEACHRQAQQYMVQRFREHFKGRWAIFCTATYKPEALQYIESYDENGEVHYTPCANIDDFRLMIKRIRRHHLFSRDFTYWCAVEYGGKYHRPHYHYFIFVDKKPEDNIYTGRALAEEWNDVFVTQWKRNITPGRRNGAEYMYLSKFIRKTKRNRGTYDVHLVESKYDGSDNPDDVIFYASKYCIKFDNWSRRKIQAFHESMEYEDFKAAKKRFRPRFLLSRGFGISKDTPEFVARCIDWSLRHTKYFCYVNVDGKTFPLARYYRKKYLTFDNLFDMVKKNLDRIMPLNGEYVDVCYAKDVVSRDDLKKIQQKEFDFNKICLHLSKVHQMFIFDDE